METTTAANNLKNARNIGDAIVKRLNEIGIYSLADLAEITPVMAYKKICKQNPEKTFSSLLLPLLIGRSITSFTLGRPS